MIALRSCELAGSSVSLLLRFEIVPNSPLCHKVLRLCRYSFQFFADAADMHVYGADIAAVFKGLDHIQQIVPGVDPVGIAHQ